MQILVKVSMPPEKFNDAVRDGSAGRKLSGILDELKPDIVYFTEFYGRRGCILIITMDDAAQIPRIAEPFFLLFNAEVEFHVVMSPEDLKRSGLEEIGQQWS